MVERWLGKYVAYMGHGKVYDRYDQIEMFDIQISDNSLRLVLAIKSCYPGNFLSA